MSQRGKLSSALPYVAEKVKDFYEETQKKGWTVVDMKQDWKVIYPLENR